ncbi:DNA polymerase III subunit chi [Haemophilus haemolyticus]|nr:DNA polymerase III subunit chi [Haemophilus haemolyticus]
MKRFFIYANSSITPELIFQLKDNYITQFSEFLPSWCEKILNNLRNLGFVKTF